jgi:hypothetical protein
VAAFATASDLATRLNVTFTAGQTAQATQLLDGASAYIRALVGGHVSAVAGDVVTLLAPPGYWLHLPHGPVTAVASVVLDGEAVTDYQRVGRRLYLADGWRNEFANSTGSSEDDDLTFAVVTYTHGYSSADDLALAKDACLVMAAASVSNVSGAKRERIDDYELEFHDLNTSALGKNLERLLVKKYGARPSTGSVDVR